VIELRAAGLVVIASQVLGVASSAPCPGMLDINAAESATPVANPQDASGKSMKYQNMEAYSKAFMP